MRGFESTLKEELHSTMCYYSTSWSEGCKRCPDGYFRSTGRCSLDIGGLIDNSDDVSIRNWDDGEVKSMESTWHNGK